jgi:glycosyltransferase involved in cell wall biosynthesis
MALRIAHVTATFPPYAGGTGNVAWHLAEQLARLGLCVDVLTADAGGARLAPARVRVRRLRAAARIGNAPFLPGLAAALRGYDLVHLHYPFFFGAELVWLATRLFRMPYVVSYHNDVELPGLMGTTVRIQQRIVGQRILMNARRILFTTLDYARTSTYVGDLARSAKAMELPGGVDVQRFHPGIDGMATRRRVGLTHMDRCVVFVGGLDQPHYFKGVHVLLDALARIQGPSVHAVVIGDGELRESYARQATQLGLSGRVHFTGRVPDADLPAYLAASDVLVLPSVTRGEAFGLVLLEAMACGKPVIASNLPGVRSLVAQTGGGEVVPPGDAGALAEVIERMLSDAERRSQLGVAGRLSVEQRYAWPRIGERLLDVYTAVLNRMEK